MAAPANDNLANATVVTGTTTSGNTTEATSETGELKGTGNSTTTVTAAGFRTVWFRWVARYTGGSQILNTTGTAFDTYLSVFTAKSGVTEPVTAHTDLDLIASDDDSGSGGTGASQVNLTTVARKTYYVQVTGFSGSDFGAYVFNYPTPAGPAPANDDIANATVLAVGTTQYVGTSLDATAEVGELTGTGPSTTTNTMSAAGYWTVWHRWVAPSTTPATFTTVGTTADDAYLSVFKPTGGGSGPVSSVGDLDFVAADDDSAGGTNSSVTITPVAGVSYYVQYRSVSPSSGAAYTLNYPSPGAATAGTVAATLPALGVSASGISGTVTPPAVTGTPQAAGFTTSGTVVTYTGGGTTGVTTYDLLLINSDNTVTVPEFGTPIESRVGSQGAYIFARQYGTTTATINLGGGISTDTNVLWLRITNTGGYDTGTTAGVDGVTGSATPALTSSALATVTEMAVAFTATHSLGVAAPAGLTWSAGYTQQTEGSSGTGSTGVYGAVAVKTPAGTAAESPSASWSNGSVPSDRYLLFAAFLGAVSGAESATISAGLPALTAAVAGTASTAGTATVGFAALQVSAAGESSATGQGTLSLPSLTAQAAGTASVAAAATAALPALLAAVAGDVTGVTSGSITATLPALTVAVSGTASASASATVMLPAFTAAVSGQNGTAQAAVAVSLPALQAAVTGSASSATGTTTVTLPRLGAAIVGEVGDPYSYADPETLLGAWIKAATGIKTWVDPILPGNWKFTAAIAHIQRGQSFSPVAITLDDVVLDVDVYAADADHARQAAARIQTALEFQLPHTTFPNGIFCTAVSAVSRPTWAPDPKVYRRTASYRIILHGVI